MGLNAAKLVFVHFIIAFYLPMPINPLMVEKSSLFYFACRSIIG